MSQKQLAPVAMFVYNRADNARRTLQALMRNTLAPETDLFVFCDGGKDEKSWKAVNFLRRMLREMREEALKNHRLRSVTLVEREKNIYLEENILQGIAQVMKDHDRIIVLEDDIVTGPFFLQWMNEGLELYQDSPRVMHIAGFTHLCLPEGVDGKEFYFTPHMSGWGWATWRDKWQAHFRHFENREQALDGLTPQQIKEIEYDGEFPCLKHLDQRPIPWDVCWEIAIKKANGLCLSPCRTLVKNVGLYNGTHFFSSRLIQHFSYDRPALTSPVPLTLVENPQATPWVEQAFKRAIRHWGIVYTPLGKIIRRIYLFIKGKEKR